MTDPECFADNGYLSGDSTPLLVAKDRRTGMTFAAAVSMRGGGDPHAARLLAKWIDGLGCQEVTVRTDGEPNICELIRRVRALRAEGTATVDEVSSPGDSAGFGIAERAILTVGGLVRTTKAVVEENVLESRDASPRLTARMVHYAAQVICACMVGADGLTRFRRLKGRKFGTPLAGFGERVWLRDPVLERANKFNPRCTEARLLGFTGGSVWSGQSGEPTPTTDGKCCHQETLSRPPIWSQHQLNSHARKELEEKSIPLRIVWTGTLLTLSRP